MIDSGVCDGQGWTVKDYPLCRRFGVDAAARAQRLNFLGISDADCACMLGLRPIFERIADDMVDDFYEHVLSFEGTARFLGDPTLVTSLKQAQRTHFVGLAAGTYDADYFESRLRVGTTHTRIGLEPEWYIGGYMRQAAFLQRRLVEELKGDAATLAAAARAVPKIILLDIGLANDAYIHGGFVERSLADAHAREADRAQRALSERDEEAARRERLLQMVMHDVRSPVTAMMATARVGLRHWRDTTEPPGKQFSLIEESGNGVLRIIDNMVSIARTPHGELPVHPERFDIQQCVRACAEALRSFAEQHNHSLVTECAGDLWAESLDPILVRRVVSNLLVNAIRHTPSGTSVRTGCLRTDHSICIAVEDDGQGIPRRQRERLFEPRGAGTRPLDGGEGAWLDTGLGLPFCALACRSMGGSIRLEDRPQNSGTRFIVELPLRP
ncbi:MAG: signal transduction histidine kinase [Hyphomicrobiaceae bacterium]|jgi:signal transduction histidine kinase